MPNSYSLDLRVRVVNYVDLGNSCEDAAELFDVSFSAVRAWMRLRDTTGSLERAPHGGGQRPGFDEAGSACLRQLVEEKPDRTNKELVELLVEAGHARVDPSTISRQCRRLGISRKKNTQSGRARPT
jgi:transposase